MIATHPALRLLAKRKLRGFWRTQLRRVKTPKGALFALLGAGAIVLWLGAMVLGQFVQPAGAQRATTESMTALFMLMGIGVTLLGSLSYRGLYIPEEELDLLLSAPVSRGDIVRYRMMSSLVRTAFGALVVSIFAAGKAPNPLYGFVGVWTFVVTLPVFGQALSLLAGGTESGLGKRLERFPKKWFGIVSVVLVGLMMFALFSGSLSQRLGPALGFASNSSAWLESPWVRGTMLLVKPWTAMVHAHAFTDFALWLGCAVCVWLFAFEFCARLRVDFRELTLATAADVAKKIARRRRGGASSGDVWKSAVGWRIPWAFGRGMFGAIAWRKSSSIVRKAGATLLISVAVVGVLTFSIDAGMSGKSLESLMTSSLFLVAIGSLYLTTGLRFDFREDLERMDVIKSWPVAPWKIFVATLLPEVVLVTALLCIAIIVRAVMHDMQHGILVLIVPAVGFFVFVCVALDNALFLFMPVRYVPGQDGGLQNAGRATVMMLARLVLFGFTAAGAVLPALLAMLIGSHVELGEAFVWSAALVGAIGVLAIESFVAIWIGGKLLARFDVARDRG
ncbi:MAG: putative ABC exporter domain-containing protein [Planctomycetes bacterium]|nr:putative ABC exporter domain-containing protein [Planctomycetota bacterium]